MQVVTAVTVLAWIMPESAMLAVWTSVTIAATTSVMVGITSAIATSSTTGTNPVMESAMT